MSHTPKMTPLEAIEALEHESEIIDGNHRYYLDEVEGYSAEPYWPCVEDEDGFWFCNDDIRDRITIRTGWEFWPN